MREVFMVSYQACRADGNPSGAGRIIGVFEDHSVAVDKARGQGDFHNDGIIETAYIGDDGRLYKLILDEHVTLGVWEDPAQIKKRALAKLTPAERKALGL